MTTVYVSETRIAAVDAARGLALLAMAIYHFTWDLEFFGYVERGMTTTGGWRLFARAIAGSFLFLVGFSLVLAHGKIIRWRSFAKRIAMIGGAALAITVVTRIATPDRYIFFGILHCITISSVVGLAFLRIPALATALAGVAVILFAPTLTSPWFDHPALLWLGLSAGPVRSNDYVPLVPWLGWVLLGMAAARVAMRTHILARLASLYRGADPIGSGLMFAGRHSLATYLIHQPVLIGMIYLFSLIAPAQGSNPAMSFTSGCNRTCQENNAADFCTRFCGCAVERLVELDLLDAVLNEGPEAQTRPEVQRTVQSCTAEALTTLPD